MIVNILVSSEISEKYELQYSLDGTSWNKYRTDITMEENGAIYARLVNELYEVVCSATGTVSNIDKAEPVGKITSTANYNSISISVVEVSDQASEKGKPSGIAGYSYSVDSGAFTDMTESNQKTFSNLQTDSEHLIAVKIIDKAGNVKEISARLRTRAPNYIVKNGKIINGKAQYHSGAETGGHSQQNGFRRIAMRGTPDAHSVGGFDVNCTEGAKTMVLQVNISCAEPNYVRKLILRKYNV